MNGAALPSARWLHANRAANALADQSKLRRTRSLPVPRTCPDIGVSAEPDPDAIENRARLFRLVSELPGSQLARDSQQRFVEQSEHS